MSVYEQLKKELKLIDEAGRTVTRLEIDKKTQDDIIQEMFASSLNDSLSCDDLPFLGVTSLEGHPVALGRDGTGFVIMYD